MSGTAKQKYCAACNQKTLKSGLCHDCQEMMTWIARNVHSTDRSNDNTLRRSAMINFHRARVEREEP